MPASTSATTSRMIAGPNTRCQRGFGPRAASERLLTAAWRSSVSLVSSPILVAASTAAHPSVELVLGELAVDQRLAEARPAPRRGRRREHA